MTSGSVSWTPSLDGLRKKLTKGLAVRVEQPEARRGEEIQAVVTIVDLAGLGTLEVGLVCVEHYDEETYTGGESGGASRTTSTSTQHEQWQPLPSQQGEHSVRFTIPQQGPFSYEGSCLSLTWEVVARGARKRALDAKASQEITVRP